MITVIEHCIVTVLCIFFEYTVGPADLDLLFTLQWLWYKLTSVREKFTLKWVLCSSDSWECQTLYTVIYLQFWLMGARTRFFPYQRVQLQTYESRILFFNDKSAILLHPRTCRNKNFASQRQNDAQKMQYAQVTKSLLYCNCPRILFNPALWHWPTFYVPVFWLWQTYIYMTLLEQVWHSVPSEQILLV